jgi:type II pantothenate kinase
LASPSSHPLPSEPALGADVGATLIKLAIRNGSGETELESAPAEALDDVARRVSSLQPLRIALTGGGAGRLARLIPADTARVQEFEAWGTGAHRMLRQAGSHTERFLLVSVGTGTSAMLVDGGEVRRVGGTALGGGTVLGLGAALLGTRRFDDIANLAREGDRRRVDLLVSDIYGDEQFSLPGDVNAASFAKLASVPSDATADRRDLAHSVMGLVGENVGLICCGLAAATKVERIVFGGSTLRDNDALVQILGGACRALGREPLFLPGGEFAGAIGALELSGVATRVG